MSAQIPQPVVAQMFSGNGPAQVTQIVRLVDTETGDVIERMPGIAREIIECNKGRFVYEHDYVAPAPTETDDDEGEGEGELPSTRALPEALAAITDPEVITAMAARDTRKKAAPLYAARLAALAASTAT